MIESESSNARGRRGRLLLRILMIVVWVGLAVWVISLVLGQFESLAESTSLGPLIGGIVLALLGYSALTAAGLAVPWWWLLAAFGDRPAMRLGVEVWARTQIGRYLPGNVVHYLGRQVMGRRFGLGQKELAAASTLELASIVAAAVIVMALATGLGSVPTNGVLAAVMQAAAALVAVAFLGWTLVDRMVRRVPQLRDRFASVPRLDIRRFAKLMGPAVLLHVLFLCGTGGMFWLVAHWGWDQGPTLAHAIRAYALAWSIGTLTPGVPAGAGVREAVIVQDLGPIMGDAQAATAAVALRAATVGGDALTFVWGTLLRARRGAGHEAQEQAIN